MKTSFGKMAYEFYLKVRDLEDKADRSDDLTEVTDLGWDFVENFLLGKDRNFNLVKFVEKLRLLPDELAEIVTGEEPLEMV
jgi:hypothetical protein